MLKKIYNSFLRKTNPLKYAKRNCAFVGEEVRICGNTNFGSEPWLIYIGNHVLMSGNISFITHDGSTFVFRDKPRYKDVIKYGKIKIGNNCFVGYNVTILPGVTIGNNVIVGAGSLVTKSIPDGIVVCGTPAKEVCTVQEFAEKCLANTPDYDVVAYKKDKKAEILRVLQND